LNLREVSRVPVSYMAYGLYIRQGQQATVQIFSLDYGDKLRTYDVSGKQRSARTWSSKVRCIAVGDVEGEGTDSLVGGVDSRLMIVGQTGKPVWDIKLESDVVACDARDVDGDDAAEVAVALQNGRVILYNDDKTALFSRKMDNPIADVWLEDITEDAELEVVVADREGWVHILTTDGYELKKLRLGEAITVFGVLRTGKRRTFVTGDHSSTLRVWDLDGNAVASLELTGKPRALATGMPDDVTDLAYMVVSTDDRFVSFWDARDASPVTKDEGRVLQEMESTKTTLYRRAIKCGNCGAPALIESKKCESCGAVLEQLDEYVTEEFIKESIDSVTSKHNPIKLRELDRIIRRTLARPATYHLRRGLQSMIENHEIEGYIDGNQFVRTKKPKAEMPEIPKPEEIRKASVVLLALLKGQDRIEIDAMESETGVPREILRKTLMILLGEGQVRGLLSGDVFILGKDQDTSELVRKLERELLTLAR